ncbi:MAG: zinc transporter substrate-binding protein [Patescibacteria group bacterium]|jgi:zinc transport system substrate-binding protein|nr:zinc transporter substrate-binding protein [Patescibacteria group bacterium]
MKKSTRIRIAILGLLTTFIALGVVFSQSLTKNDDKITVAASFYPLGHFAEKVTGDLASVKVITPAGIEPHDFEPTAQDIVTASEADLFFYNGNGLDPWTGRLVRSGPSLSMSDHLASVTTQDDGHDHEHAEEEQAPDPHFWLDPVNAQKEVELIRDALIDVDPQNAATYRANAESFISDLQALDNRFKTGLGSCRVREAFTSHAAFAYMAKRYDFTMTPIAGLSPEAEPAARHIADLSVAAKAKGIKYIFMEALASPRISQTLAQEVGAEVLVLDPLEGLSESDLKAGKTYVSVMDENLKNLRLAMECN